MTVPAPDLRLHQSNERTLLAWLRTGIALMAFGFVVARFGVWMRLLVHVEPIRSGSYAGLGVAFVGLGTLANLLGGIQYVRIRRSLLAGRTLSAGGILPPMLALILTLLGGVLGAYLIARA